MLAIEIVNPLNGKVLFFAGPVDGLRDSYLEPDYVFEYDGTAISRVAEPDSTTGDTVPYQGRMMLLPSGQVLLALATDALYCYTPDGSPQSAWRPAITSAPRAIRSGLSYTLQGTQLNGLSQAVSYGDDFAGGGSGSRLVSGSDLQAGIRHLDRRALERENPSRQLAAEFVDFRLVVDVDEHGLATTMNN